MNPSQYPQDVYHLLYADEAGEIVGLDEVQYLEAVPAERISALVSLLSNEDAYLAYQCGLILAAWGVKEGIEHLRQLVETRVDKIAEFEPHRLWGQDNVYDIIAHALWMGIKYGNYSKKEVVAMLSEILKLYGECFYESKLKYVLIDGSFLELLPDIKQGMQLALENERYYQASQLLPVLVKYDSAYAFAQVDIFRKLIAKDKRIQYNLEEMQALPA